MRAVVIHGTGDLDRLVLEERPTPAPGPHQVRVKVVACAMNHLDTWVRRGVPGHQFPLPLVPGCDFAGTVDALGAGSRTSRSVTRSARRRGSGAAPARRARTATTTSAGTTASSARPATAAARSSP